MKTLILRLSEPSTYAGLAAVAAVLGYSSEQYASYAAAAAGLFGFVAIMLGEKGNA